MAKYMKKIDVVELIKDHEKAVCGSDLEGVEKIYGEKSYVLEGYRLAHEHLVQLFELYDADGAVVDIPTSAWFTTEKEGVFRCIACSSEFKIPCIDGEPIWKGCPICLARMVKVSQ